MSTNQNKTIIEQALAARTVEQAEVVQNLIAAAIGKRHQRPLGNTWNNQGILTGSGSSYDHKAVEVVTNMQDAVLELLAIQEYGSRDDVPFSNPQEAASALLGAKTKKDQANLAHVTIDKAGASNDKKQITLVVRDAGCGITPIDVPQGIFRVGSKNNSKLCCEQNSVINCNFAV